MVLARAFVQQAETLLLDEPTNNLDPANQQEVMREVRREVDERGIAACAVMHDINLAIRYCDCFLFLKDGKVDAAGAHQANLRHGRRHYRARRETGGHSAMKGLSWTR